MTNSQEGRESNSYKLSAPKKCVDFEDLSDPSLILEMSKLYFWVNKSAKDKMKWDCAFLVLIEGEGDCYLLSDVFKLGRFNKISYELNNDYNCEYGEVIKEFIHRCKEENLKPIESDEVFDLLSGQSIDELGEQKLVRSIHFNGDAERYSDADNWHTLIDVFENYALMWDNGEKHEKKLSFFFYRDVDKWCKWIVKKHKKDGGFEKEYPSSIIIESKKGYIERSDVFNQSADVKEKIVPKLRDHLLPREIRSIRTTARIMEITGDKHIKGDHQILIDEHSSFVLYGDLLVDGTLSIDKANQEAIFCRGIILVFGEIRAKNLVLDRSPDLVFVRDGINVSNITLHSSIKEYGPKTNKELRTYILLHSLHTERLEQSAFEYDKQMTANSVAIIDDSVVNINRDGDRKFDAKKIHERLLADKDFVNVSNIQANDDQVYATEFSRMMKSWEYYYYQLAGCEMLDVYDADEFVEKDASLHDGDWVIVDRRSNSGTYIYYGDDGSIHEHTLKNPKKFGVDYSKKPIKRKVDAVTLMYRYQWMISLFMDWPHRLTASPIGTFEDQDHVLNSYQKEKEGFEDDPHLALYWLLHFGFSLDRKYKQVVKAVEKNRLEEKLKPLALAMAFFRTTDQFTDVIIGSSSLSTGKEEKELEAIFLKRRAFLVYATQSYEYRGGEDGLENWFNSVAIYPKADKNLPRRIMWLKNNLEKFDEWNAFDELVNESKIESIDLISYIYALNPYLENRGKFADIFISEVIAHKNLWKEGRSRETIQEMLWDVRELAGEKSELEKAADYYFHGEKLSDRYEDILQSLGVRLENKGQILDTVRKLEEIFERFEDVSKFELAKKSWKLYSLLKNLSPKDISSVAENLVDSELQIKLFHYLFLSNFTNKKDALLSLFIALELSESKLVEAFKMVYPNLIKDEKDPNFEIAKSFMFIPEDDFRNDSVWERSKETAVLFFVTIAHIPAVFDFLIDTLIDENQDNDILKENILSEIFTDRWQSNTNISEKFSKAQVEKILETASSLLLRSDISLRTKSEASSLLFYCNTPLARDWVEKHLIDDDWLDRFKSRRIGLDDMREEVKSSLEESLESITKKVR